MLWHLDDDWVVLGIEYVAARAPHRPWTLEDLDAVLDALEVVADELTPVPDGLDLDAVLDTLEVVADELTPVPDGLHLDDAVDDFAPMVDGWASVRETHPDLPHLDEAEALARRYAEACAGDTLVHTDVRSDNVLIDSDGRALVCDWNWPVRGSAWFDSFAALIGPRGEGVDVDAVIAQRRLLRDVPPEAVDIMLAFYVGYFFAQCVQPVPPTSPHIREHQRWQGEVCWQWLAERRGWS